MSAERNNEHYKSLPEDQRPTDMYDLVALKGVKRFKAKETVMRKSSSSPQVDQNGLRHYLVDTKAPNAWALYVEALSSDNAVLHLK